MSGLDPLTHENDMYILVIFITNSLEIKANQSQTSCAIAPTPSCVLSASKNNYRIAVV